MGTTKKTRSAAKKKPGKSLDQPMENPFTGYRQARPRKGAVPRKIDLDKPMENPFEGIEKEKPESTSMGTVPRKSEAPVRRARLPPRKPRAGPRGTAELVKVEPRGRHQKKAA